MHVPSITFDVKYNSKPRQLIMTKGGVHCRRRDNWRADIWSASVSNLLRIEQHPEQKSHLRVVVVNTYDIDAEDPQQVLRILGAAKNLDLGQEKESKSSGEGKKRPGGHTDSSSQERGRTHQSVIDEKGVDGVNKRLRASKGDFKTIRMIGKGSFGEVSLVRHRRTDQTYAMKVMKKSDCEELYDDVYSEMKILAMLSHPFIVRMHYWYEDQEHLYYILDYVSGGELYDAMRRKGRFPEDWARFYMAEIVLALEYLHKDGVVYRDLKPENLLLDSEGHIKLTDFGLSKAGITSAGGGAQTFCGTPQYLAPEILRAKEHGTAVDWWSAGVVLYEMVTSKTPFQSATRKEMYTKVFKGHIAFPLYISPPCKSIIQGLLVRRPQDRLGSGPLGVSEIKAQSFFSRIDWEALLRKQIRPPYVPPRQTAAVTAPKANPSGLTGRSTRMDRRSGYGRGPENNSILRSTRGAAALMPRTNAKASFHSGELTSRLDALLDSVSARNQRSNPEASGRGGRGNQNDGQGHSGSVSNSQRATKDRRVQLELGKTRVGLGFRLYYGNIIVTVTITMTFTVGFLYG
ncbi:hypothetical protein AAMO2058_001520800 [Amorphochlora amoebiformis]